MNTVDATDLTLVNVSGHFILIVPRYTSLPSSGKFFVCDTIVIPKDLDKDSRDILMQLLPKNGHWIEY